MHLGNSGQGRLDQASPAMSTDMKESPAEFFVATLDEKLVSNGELHSTLDYLNLTSWLLIELERQIFV